MRPLLVLTRAFLKLAWRGRPSMRRRREGRPPSRLDPLRPLLYAVPQTIFTVGLLTSTSAVGEVPESLERLAHTGPHPAVAVLQALATLQFFLTVISTLAMESDLVFRTADVHVLFHRPIADRTYLAARFTALFGHMAVLTAIASGPPAIILAAYYGRWMLAPAWVLGMLLTTLAGLVLALLVMLPLLRALGRRRVARAMPFVQAVAGLVFIVGYQFVLVRPDGGGGGTLPLLETSAYAWFPASWGAAVARWIGGLEPAGMAAIAVRGTAASLVAAAALVAVLGRVYRTLLEEFERVESGTRGIAPARRPSAARRLAERITAGTPDARAGMRLAWALLFRAPDVRARMMPMLLIPVGVFAAQAARDGGRAIDVIVILAPSFVANFSAGIVLALTRSRHWQARWIFDALPLGDRRVALRGACLSVLLRLGLPMALIYGALSGVLVSAVDGVGTALATFGLLALGLGVGSQRQATAPFSREPAHDAYEGCGTVFVMMLLGLAVVGMQAGLRFVHPALGLLPPVATIAISWTWWIEPLRGAGRGGAPAYATVTASDR